MKNTIHTSNATNPLSDADLIVQTLYALDLEQLQDWPNITSQSLNSIDAGRGQQLRIQHVEWALFQLFRKWNAQEAAVRLEPFFPPREPVQSSNLRAAQFRWLEQLNAGGIFGKESIIRKTMFEDCRGQKFIKLILIFASVVLQKKLTEDELGSQSIATQISGVATQVPSASMVLFPLTMAHKVSLRRKLKDKHESRQRFRDFGAVLCMKERELDRKFDRVMERQEFLDRHVASEATVARVAKQLENHWHGGKQTVDVIAQGHENTLIDKFLEHPYGRHWNEVRHATFIGDLSTTHCSLLEDLEGRLAIQQERLRHWKMVRDKAKVDVVTVTPCRQDHLRSPSNKGAAAVVKKEKDLVFSPRKSPRKSEYPAMATSDECMISGAAKYAEKNASHPKEGERLQKDRQIQFLRSDLDNNLILDSTPTALQGSPSSDMDDSGFSEIVQEYTIGIAHTSSQGISPIASARNERTANAMPWQAQSRAPASCSPGKKQCDPTHDIVSAHTKLAEHQQATLQENDIRAQQGPVSDDTLSPYRQSSGRPMTEQLSLVERTRKSMAFASPKARLVSATPIIPTQPCRDDALQEEAVIPAPGFGTDTLIERTRKSISLVPSRSHSYRKSLAARRTSKLYPTNQFETPRRPSVIQELTPPEELYSPQAGYDSVFKSRPKVGNSPTASPTIMDENEPIIQTGANHVDLESPLGRFRVKT